MRADAIVVGGLLQNRGRFAVPIYQRHYVWNRKDQWEPLWLDIRAKAIERLNNRGHRYSHYMGAVVLEAQTSYSVRRVQTFQVVDGQQRLTTFQLFLAAARDYAAAIKYDSAIANINRYILNSDAHLMEEPNVELYKVWPTLQDRDIFRDILNIGSRSKLREKYREHFYAKRDKIYDRASTPRMLAAYGFFFDQIKHGVEVDGLEDTEAELVEDEGDIESEAPTATGEAEIPREVKFDQFWQSLIEEFKLVQIVLEEGDDAQVIFETLNGRGEPLLAADLVRNNIFHRAASKDENAEKLFLKHWKHFEDPFWEVQEKQGRNKKPRIEFYIANFIASQIGGEVSISKLFSEYKAFVKSRKFASVEAEVEELLKYSVAYRTLVSRSGDSNLAGFVAQLAPWDVTTVHPMAMRVWAAGLQPDQERACYEILLSFIVRRAVCGLTPKNYNKLFLSAIGALDRKSWSSQALHDFFARQTGESARWPRDSEFEESWVTRPSYITLGPTKTRALLAEIERRKRGKLQETASLSSTLTVEHILPQEWREHWPLQGGVKPTPDEWKAASFSVHEDASRIGAIVRRNRTCHTIGNLTLLTQPLNATISNASFSKKKTAIDKQTVLLLNREIARENQWEEGQIEARARALFGLAKEIWVGPSS